MASKKDDKHAEVELAKVIVAGQVTRWLIVGLVVLGCVYFISNSIVKILDKPAWLELSTVIVVSLIGPTGVIMVALKARKKYISKTHKRTIELEKRLDPERSSSGEPKSHLKSVK